MRTFARSRAGFTLIELLVVIAIIAVLMSILLPAVQSAREAARLTQCRNNLHNLGIALHNYHDSLGSFPSGYISNSNDPARDPQTYDGPQGWAWGALLLPYMEQGSLSGRFDMNRPCWDPANAELARTQLPAFLCPSAAGGDGPFEVKNAAGTVLATFARSSYVANVGQEEPWGQTLTTWDGVADGPLYRNSRVREADVRDGLSNTVFLGEHHPVISSKTWVGVVPGADVCPTDPDRFPGTTCDAAATLVQAHSGPAAGELDVIHPPNAPTCHVCQMYAEHHGGCNVLLGDGRARFVSEFINADTWAALSSRAKREVVADY